MNKPVYDSKSTEKNTNQTVRMLTITEDEAGQRIDNYLISKLKGVPKSLVYRILRKGEVRINKGRIKPDYKLQNGDVIRIPPIRISEKEQPPISNKLNKVAQLERQIIFEDDYLLVINKPPGIAVHGGSGLSFGIIEALRSLRPDARFLELVHRLDRDTSGVLLVAKKRSALRNLHEQLRIKTVQKEYLALVRGHWQSHCKSIQAPLLKNELASGERIVRVNEQGKPSETRFSIEERYANATLIKASPITGRTHQIRVHTQYAGHPIALDDKYGDKEFDRKMADLGLDRLFLHALTICFVHPKSGETLRLSAPLDPKMKGILQQLRLEKG
ncbi:MAG TPA: 23S rRNA pseudouridine(955/2504/2580) synthase RluC [Pasteurellaceae bacterium]|nr:23S rRNA pseudouridine(955/2504/2580) synthase RluC [Pasteurellaceae bacterium]